MRLVATGYQSKQCEQGHGGEVFDSPFKARQSQAYKMV